MLTLSGCAGLHAGEAAVIGSDTISRDSVDGVARALCTANVRGAAASGGLPPSIATRGVRSAALQVLLDTELSRQFGESEGVTANKQMVSRALAAQEQEMNALPEAQRADYAEALKNYAEGQLMLVEVGRRSLAEQGKTEVDETEALAEGNRLRSEFAENIDVEVDPRYGSYERGTVRPGQDLSIAASDRARAGERAQPSDSFVAGLPASQKCS